MRTDPSAPTDVGRVRDTVDPGAGRPEQDRDGATHGAARPLPPSRSRPRVRPRPPRS